MKYNEFDEEYYIMDVSGADNYPNLAFCKSSAAFSYAEPIKEVELPIQTKFSKTTRPPKNPKFVDALFLKGNIAISKRVFEEFENLNLYGLQMLPIEITTPKEEIVKDYYVMHIWNEIAAVDKNNYVGDEPDGYGGICGLESFSLDEKNMINTPIEKRLIFKLAESTSIMLVRQSVYDAIQSLNPEGFSFWKVSEWNIGSAF